MQSNCEDDPNLIGRDDDTSGSKVDDDYPITDAHIPNVGISDADLELDGDDSSFNQTFNDQLTDADISAYSEVDYEAQLELMPDIESESGDETDSSPEIEAKVEVPEAIRLRTLPLEIDCHPKRNLIAAGLIDGDIELHSYGTGDEKNLKIQNCKHHETACQAVHFSSSGDMLFSGDSDGNIYELDFEENLVARDYTRQDGSGISCMLQIDENLLASAEDDGHLVLWDARAWDPIECFTDCEFPISSLAINEDKQILLATCHDSGLIVYDVRTKKLVTQSEKLSSHLKCCGIFKGGTKAVVGSVDGALNIFNWGEFDNVSERFPSHPQSVDSLVVLSDDVVITGCVDGKVRAVQLFPNRVLYNLGNHRWPIDTIRLTYDSKFVASSSYNHKIKFWDLSGIDERRNEDVRD